MKLSKLDKQILRHLQRDAGVSIADIADKIGLSQPPTWRRVKRLEKEGVIKRKVALLDQKKLGLGLTLFARVKLSNHGRQSIPEFEAEVRKFPQVLECFLVLGEYDFLLKVVAQDIESYEDFFRNHLMKLKTVEEVHSNMALAVVKDTTELPVA